MQAEQELKLKKLQAVFLKVIDASTDSISSAELKDCFKESKIGSSSVENAFINSIGSLKSSLEV